MKDPSNTARPRSIFMAAGLFLCVAIFTTAMFGQDEPIRVATDLVTIPLTVIDREGRYVGSLKPNEFPYLREWRRTGSSSFHGRRRTGDRFDPARQERLNGDLLWANGECGKSCL